MASTYKAQILTWQWDIIKSETASNARDPEHLCGEGCDAEGHVGYSYLGSVMSLAPSGKFYAPWSWVASDDRDKDARWFAALEQAATKHGGWVENGEGDPTDLYYARYWSTADLSES